MVSIKKCCRVAGQDTCLHCALFVASMGGLPPPTGKILKNSSLRYHVGLLSANIVHIYLVIIFPLFISYSQSQCSYTYKWHSKKVKEDWLTSATCSKKQTTRRYFNTKWSFACLLLLFLISWCFPLFFFHFLLFDTM